MRNMVEHWHDGRINLFLVWKAIRFRRENAALFHEGDFLPLETRGECRQNVVCFMRRKNGSQIFVVVPRWLSQVASSARGHGQRDWHNTEVVLPPNSSSRWRSVVSGHEVMTHPKMDTQSAAGESLRVEDLFEHFPVAFFHSAS
jgi:(1->4)-alpha-D-glucan 1-alpha-D-glucosylmutase